MSNANKPLSIFLSAGHSIKDTGAISEAFKENLLCMEFRDALAATLREFGFVVITPDDRLSLSETIEAAKNLKSDIHLELHFNAGPETACGAEVFFAQDAPMSWKHMVGKFIWGLCERIGQKCRGSKSETQSARKRLGFLRLPNSMLLEIEFMTNKEATKKLLDDVQGWAQSAARELAFLAVELREATKKP